MSSRRPWHERPLVARPRQWVERDLWHLELAGLPTFRAWLMRAVRIGLITVRGFRESLSLQQAGALTYITIFSLPPVLAFAFAAAKGFGLYETLKAGTIDPFLDDTFGARGSGTAVNELRQAVDQIFNYVETTDLKALGSLALVFMLYSVVRMLGAIEKTLNQIWGVQRPRTIVRKVSDYMAIVVVTPLFLFIGATVSTLLRQRMPGMESGGALAGPWVQLTPVVAVWLGMSFAYLTLPNTTVRVPSALLGGVVAGTLWQVVQSLYVTGQLELARYNTIYAGFAAIPMLLFWIYVSWVVFLLGAHLAFARQHEPTYTTLQRTGRVDDVYRERLAPRLAGRIAAAFLEGRQAPTGGELASAVDAPTHAVVALLDTLVARGLLVRTEEGDDERFLPARDPARITLVQVQDALRRDPAGGRPGTAGPLDEAVDRHLAGLARESEVSDHNVTLEDLTRTPPRPVAERGPAGDADLVPRPDSAPHPSS